jgi:hypothetical protein
VSFDSTRIQQDTKAFRAKVAGWSEDKLRKEGEARGIPGAETLDRTTLREAIVQDERDALRAEVHGSPILPDSPAKLGPQS